MIKLQAGKKYYFDMIDFDIIITLIGFDGEGWDYSSDYFEEDMWLEEHNLLEGIIKEVTQ